MPDENIQQTTGGAAVTRTPVYPDDRAVGNAYRPGADYFVFVGGVKIGGTYWASSDSYPRGQKWVSWGVGGLSMRHRTREAAEQVQVDAYREGVPQGALDRVARAKDADAWCWR
jgi:hypothetical protein